MTNHLPTPRPRYPLNESQRRALTIALAAVERDLYRVLHAIDRPAEEGQLIRFCDHPGPALCERLKHLTSQIQQYLGQLSADLELSPQEESVRRSLTASLLLDEVALEEVEPSRLRRYGAVHPAAADYLNRELPKLRALVEALRETLSNPSTTGA